MGVLRVGGSKVEQGDRRRLKQEKYPSYSFSLNRETMGLRKWLEGHKTAKRLPAVVRMGLLLVRMLEEKGYPVPEDDRAKLRLFLDFLGGPSAHAPLTPQAPPPKLNAGEVKQEDGPEENMDTFLESL